MFHIPIVNTEHAEQTLNFSHFNQDAVAGQWKKENVLACDYIKINVFVEGEFSVFSDGALHRAVYGDVCLLSPRKMHYGHIPSPTHLNYYQFDVGLHAFRAIPNGDKMVENLLSAVETRDSFIRPTSQGRDAVLLLCEEVEANIRQGELPLAYAKTIELLSLLYRLYSSAAVMPCTTFSYHTSNVIKYIESNYSEDISIERIAETANVSQSYISRIFKKETGYGIHEYLNQYRVLKATAYLDCHSVADTSFLCGFCDSSHFISIFKKCMGITPMQYKLKIRAQQKTADLP